MKFLRGKRGSSRGAERAAQGRGHMKHLIGIILVGAMVGFGAGCSDDGNRAARAAPVERGTGGTGGGGSVVDLCADAGGSGQVLITEEEITRGHRLYGRLHLHPDARDLCRRRDALTIEAGRDRSAVTTARPSSSRTPAGSTHRHFGCTDRDDLVAARKASGSPATGVAWFFSARRGSAGATRTCDGELASASANIEGLPEPEQPAVRFGGDDDDA